MSASPRPTVRRRAGFAALSAALGLVVALGATELAARLLSPGPPPPLLFPVPKRFMPRFETTGEELGKAPGEYRIVVLGDSMSWGWRMHPEDAWPDRLEWRLAPVLRPSATLNVVNAARPNWNSVQQHEFVRDRIDELRPDAVVLGFCLNDVEPSFGTPERGRFDDARRQRTPRRRLSRTLYRTSAAYRTIWRRLESARFTRAKVDVYRKTFHEDSGTWKVAIRALEGIHKELAARHVPLLIAILPMFDEAPGAAYRLREYHRQVELACLARGLDCIDLLPAFEGHDLRTLSTQPFHDSHPNEVAQRIIADALVGPIVTRGMIPFDMGPRGPVVRGCRIDVGVSLPTKTRPKEGSSPTPTPPSPEPDAGPDAEPVGAVGAVGQVRP